MGVTRRSIRAGYWYPAPAGPKSCPGARKVRRAFCRHGTNFIEHWRGRGTSFIGGRIFLPVDKAGKRYWRSIAVQVWSEADICHGAGFILRATVRVRVPGSKLVPVNGSVSCKKRDELITPTIRVMCRVSFKIISVDLFFNLIVCPNCP